MGWKKKKTKSSTFTQWPPEGDREPEVAVGSGSKGEIRFLEEGPLDLCPKHLYGSSVTHAPSSAVAGPLILQLTWTEEQITGIINGTFLHASLPPCWCYCKN